MKNTITTANKYLFLTHSYFFFERKPIIGLKLCEAENLTGGQLNHTYFSEHNMRVLIK